jgi:hypothetical protein
MQLGPQGMDCGGSAAPCALVVLHAVMCTLRWCCLLHLCPSILPLCCSPYMRWLCVVCVQSDHTPLYMAAASNHALCIELLLGKGANVDKADNVGEGLQGGWVGNTAVSAVTRSRQGRQQQPAVRLAPPASHGLMLASTVATPHSTQEAGRQAKVE